MDVVGIRELELKCIVGIRPYERELEQRVLLDLELGIDTRPAGRSGRIALTVDYDHVANAISAMLRFRRYRLMESAAEELCAMLFATHAHLEHVSLKLEKPGALTGRAQGASVKVLRTRSDFPQLVTVPGAYPSPVFSSDDAVLSMVRVAPHGTWNNDVDGQYRCLNWLVQGRLTFEGKEWLSGELHGLDGPALPYWANPEPIEAVVFRCVVSGQS